MDLIRKIVVGPNPKDAMAYYVGMRAGDAKVSYIEEDEAALFRHGIRRYKVYIEDADNTYLWKSIENQPVMVEYDCKFN